MRNRSRRGGRSGALPLKMPRPGIAAIVALAFLLGALALAVVGPKMFRDVGRDAVRTWLLPVAALAFLYLFARFLLARRAAHAGAIDIAMSAPDAGVQADRIVAQLREALISVRLSSSSPVPGESAPQDFVSDVRTATATAQGWALFVAIATTFVPRNAYRVSLVIRADEASGPRAKGLTVEVRSRLSKEMSAATIWAESWKVVVDRAACHIAAHVLPRTELSRKPPWIPWRGIELDPDLFRHFQEARRLSKAGRLEEALEHFDKAIGMDPLNPYIRLEKAGVLEQLRLYIDALAIYVDIVTLESWYDRRLWKRFRRLFRDGLGEPAPRRLARSPNGPAALQLAYYRLICSLAASDRLADQWSRHWADHQRWRSGTPVDQPRRMAEAVRVISRMRHLLAAYRREMLASHGVETGPTAGDIEKDQRMLRRVFQYAALHEGLELERAYRWWRRCLRWWPGLPVSQAAIRLIPVWAALQYRFVVRVQERLENRPDLPTNLSPVSTQETEPVRLALGLCGGSWPPDATEVQRLVRRAVRRHSGWLERYNAACTYAVGMLTPELYNTRVMRFPVDEDQARNHTTLSRLAVEQLTQAVVAADSQFAAGRAPWLRRGDQDLDDLRVTEEYQTFIDRYLPEATRPPALPANLALLTMTGHFVKLVEGFARLRSAYWRDRVGRGTLVRASDLQDEARWWKLLREFCDDCRDASTRGRLIAQAATLADPDSGSDVFNPSMPGIETDHRWTAMASRENRNDEGDGGGGDQSVRVRRRLDVSRDLHNKAESLRQERNSALGRLGEALKQRDPGNRTLDGAFAPTPLPGPTSYASNSIARDLFNAWTCIEVWMKSLRSDESDDGTKAREATEAIANLLTTAAEANFLTPEAPEPPRS